jgi:hypothetical protein
MTIFKVLLAAFSAVFGVIILGGFSVMVLGGLFSAAGTLLGILASFLDIVIWGIVLYWVFKELKNMF